jgi:hypothetical protein
MPAKLLFLKFLKPLKLINIVMVIMEDIYNFLYIFDHIVGYPIYLYCHAFGNGNLLLGLFFGICWEVLGGQRRVLVKWDITHV